MSRRVLCVKMPAQALILNGNNRPNRAYGI